MSAILDTLIDAADKKPDRMVRVALLARHSGVWWEALSSNGDIVDYLHNCVMELNVSIQDNMRQYLFDRALLAFMEIKEKPYSEETKSKVHAMLAEPVFERVLYIHMAAYATVSDLDFTAQNFLKAIVDHEKSFWPIQFCEQINGDQAEEKFIRETARVITALTLFGGVDSDEKLTNIISTSKGPGDELFSEFLCNFYPPNSPSNKSNKIVGYLEPDLLGEYLVFDTLRSLRNLKRPFTDAEFLKNTFNLTDDRDELQQAFTVLGRIIEDICKTVPEKTMVEEWLSLLFDESHLGFRSLPAVGAAISLAEKTAFCPIPDILKKALDKYKLGSMPLASEIRGVLPNDSVAFRQLKLWVAKTILNDLEDKAHLPKERADAFLNYSKALSALDKRKEALDASQEAVVIYRSLVESHPDAFLPDLAMSLNNLGFRLRALGKHKEALDATQEAVAKYRSLAESRPDAFLPDLAMSLSNLGIDLSVLGKRKEALDATQEAVAKYRSLAESHPDAFLPNLAMSLNNLGIILSALDQCKEARDAIKEVVAKYWSLAESHPDVFLPNLAMSLRNLGVILNTLGQPEEALKAYNEALPIIRQLAQKYPQIFEKYLLQNLLLKKQTLRAMEREKEMLPKEIAELEDLTSKFS